MVNGECSIVIGEWSIVVKDKSLINVWEGLKFLCVGGYLSTHIIS